MSSQQAFNNAIAAILATGISVTLTPSNSSTLSAPSESTPTPATSIPSTPITTSVAQSNPSTSTRFSCLSSVFGTASAARNARLARSSNQRYESDDDIQATVPPVPLVPPILLVSVSFYLWESGKELKQLQGGLLHELSTDEVFPGIHIFGLELASCHDPNVLKQSGYEWAEGDKYLLAGEVGRHGRGPLQAQFVTDHGLNPLATNYVFCQRFPLERNTGRRRIHVVIQRAEPAAAQPEVVWEDENEGVLTNEEEANQTAFDMTPQPAVGVAQDTTAAVAPVQGTTEAPGRASSAKRRQRVASPVRRSQRRVRRRL